MRYSSLALALSFLWSLACSDGSPSSAPGMLSPTETPDLPTAEPAGDRAAPAEGQPGTSEANTGSGSESTSEEPVAPALDATGAGGAGSTNSSPTEMAAAGSGGMAAVVEPASLEWLPSWATTIQTTEPNNAPPPLANTTLRQFVWPTVSGQEIRIQLSNEKGSTPVDIQKVHIARALTQGTSGNSMGQIDPATDAAFTFNGSANVTIPAGQTVWSDALTYPLTEIQLTTVSMQFGATVPPEITGHPGSRETSYIAAGDLVSQAGMPGAQTRDRWYFINAIEVMAPSDSYAIALLGDSITDGFGVLNQFARWSDFLTLAIQNDPLIADNRSVLNFGMGANNLTTSSQYQDAGRLRFERDVLTRDKVKWLVVFEAINDIRGNVQSAPIINAYREIIQLSHAKGILVYGATITPNGPSAVRDAVNTWIRTSGEFDRVLDFDAVIRDPANVNNILPMFNNDGLHPNLAGYEAIGNSVDLSLFYETAAVPTAAQP